MANNLQELNYEEILTLIQGQLMEHMNSTEYFDKYKGTKLVLSKEQQFMKIKDKDPNAIYIVVRFGAADVMFRQTVLPATIVVLTQQNKVELAYNLMYEYAQKYNLVRKNNDTIQQVYESPSMSGNFNELYEGFRSVVTMTAAFVIGKNSNEYKVYYYYTQDGVSLAEEVPVVSTSFSFVGNPDTQAFYNTNNFAKSVIGFGAGSLSFTTFVLSDSQLINDVLDIFGTTDDTSEETQAYVFDTNSEKYFIDGVSDASTDINNKFGESFSEYTKARLQEISIIDSSSGDVYVLDTYRKDAITWKYDRTLEKIYTTSSYANSEVNKPFKMGVVYKDKKHSRIAEYKLTSANGTQDIGQIPKITLAFTE